MKKTSLRRQPQQKRSQERVERILDAAAIVFDEVGFEAATTHGIASRAKTAVGSLYQFFPDKLAIFNALELRHVERVKIMWDKLLRPEIIQLPFADFIHALVTQVEQLFEQPTSRIVFIQFFVSPTIFRNIDPSFTQEAIEFVARLLKARNPKLTTQRSLILAEICVNATNALILLALKSNQAHYQAITLEIEALLRAYLKADVGDDEVHQSIQPLDKLISSHQLNSRQSLILNYAFSNSEITIKNCEHMFPNVSRRTLQRDLKTLSDRNLLLCQGNTDQRSYRLNFAAINL
ncbi:TetR/AcrR family transcriptional regulator [Pleurocapsa sp. CCALA 161]|uniref:TetR/AcrR family transcriptional regulator n=1 Tax=Pleurocapsa sp. CCALA 161 TaxID=2107688 RepID=UPI000D0817F5|nr:TetR/AcrR family transcriptional regulator [Pleurocapsa sp. CCALA 161]PSB12495.1 TetR/AcrR family transcriptional regulator [Pleurocapsa sp. CCALA 161]